MDRYKIELILKMRPPVVSDPYAKNVADILRKPSILHPVKRYRFKQQFVNRVSLVLAEHTKLLLDNINKAQQ